MKSSKFHFSYALATFLASSNPTHSQGNVQTFWADYPPCEEACHESVYISQQCTLENDCSCSGCLCLADSCLCETGSWLIAVAQCIGQSCGASDVTTAASIVQSACNGNGFALAVGSTALVSYGLAAIPKATEAATTEAAPATTKAVEQSATVTDAPTTGTQTTSTILSPDTPTSSTSSMLESSQAASSLPSPTTLSTFPSQSSASAATTSGPTPTSTAKYDTSDKIALGCGIGIGLPAALAGIWAAVAICYGRRGVN